MVSQPNLWESFEEPKSLATPAKHLARSGDSETSRLGAESVAMRSSSQKGILLAIYAKVSEPLTDDEAAERSGLLAKPGCCWWHRSADLRHDGLIVKVGQRRSNLTGEERMTCVITEAGRRAFERMKK